MIITHKCVNDKNKDKLTDEHELYLAKHRIDLTNNMQTCMEFIVLS